MTTLTTSKYQQILALRDFRAFWLSFTFSALGDVMSRVALTWFVYDLTRSPEALGLLSLTYTGPIIVGGLLIGPLLDRFDRRKVMIADNLIRGTMMLLIPLLYITGNLMLWHIYLISTVYGALVMISLAGSPALLPDLVDTEHLDTANALETLSYTLSGVIGPPVAGLLIPLINAPNVVVVDALSYFAFALTLMTIRIQPHQPKTAGEALQTYRVTDAVRLLFGNRILLSSTFMFMLFNLGYGALLVWLPVMTDTVLGGGAGLYGLLLGATALGEVASAFLAGSWKPPLRLGTLICLAQALAGMSLALLYVNISIPIGLISLLLVGFFSAPLTIWAQTLRMKIIPPALRGRTFALLRTLMQSAFPLGGLVAGFALPLLSLPIMALVSAGFMGLPGGAGYAVRELREAE